MCFVLRRVPVILWELWRFFGIEGMLGSSDVGLANFALNFCPIFEIEPC
jgi:hypothetical protein